MKYDPQRHHRRSIRLPGFDYTQPGAYFVTLVTHERECLFGEIVNGEMRLNELGEIARVEWFQTAAIRPYAILYEDEFVVMPNHIHGIIWIVDDDRMGDPRTGDPRRGDPRTGDPRRGDPRTGDPRRGDPRTGDPRRGDPRTGDPPGRPNDPPRGPASGSIGAIMAQYKSIVTKRINLHRGTPGAPVWQRNYYEHIIRNSKELERIRQYIQTNPARWANDREKT